MALAWWLVAVVFVVYAASGQILAVIQGLSVTVVPAWSAANVYPAWAQAVALAFGLSGVAIALVVPALAWVCALSAPRLRAAPLFHRSFAANLGQAVVFISLWKAVHGTVPPRTVFIAWQALVTAAGVFILWRSRRPALRSRDAVRPAVGGGIVIVLILPLLLWGKVFVEDASGDGTEQFEFSRSLATSQLPNWDLENGFYGFYPSFMLFAYPTQMSFIAIGETEAAQRLPVFYYQFGIYLVLAELIRRRRRTLSWTEIGLLASASAALLLYLSGRSTYEVVADLAELTGTDTFFTFLVSAAFYEAFARQRAWWGLFATLGATAMASGLPVALLILFGRLVSRWPGRQWRAWRGHLLDALAFAAPLLLYHGFVAIYASVHPLGATKWALSSITEEYPIGLEAEVIGAVLANLAICVAIVPLLGAAVFAWQNRLSGVLGIVTVGYLGILIVFGRMHLHYVVSLCAFPVAMFMRGLAARTVARRVRGSAWAGYAGALSVLLYLGLLSDRTPHTAYREFGARTLMLFDWYPDAETLAEELIWERPGIFVHLPYGKPIRPGTPTRMILASESAATGQTTVDAVLEDVVSANNPASTDPSPWGISYHTWIRYADRAPVAGRRYHQILAAPDRAPLTLDGFSRRELSGGWTLFYRSGESIFTWLDARSR